MTTAALPSTDFVSNSFKLARTDPKIEQIAHKVNNGHRLSIADGELLYETPDIWTVCSLADLVRRRMHKNVAYYNINRHINYSNVCALSCSFCSFYRKKDQDGAYEFSIDKIKSEAISAANAGATELHIVGGLHPYLPFEYYTQMMQVIREVAPKLHIKAFTAVEIVHLARISKRGKQKYQGIKAVLRDLKGAGLGSLPGGGAEVFDDRVHDEAFKGKIRAGTWLDVHRAAHELGLNTNATMLYGHIEHRADRIRHMDILRKEQDRAICSWAQSQNIELQEEDAVVLTGPDEMYPSNRLPDPSDCNSGYFQTIIPLPFIPDDSAIEHLPGPTGLENLRTLAISRLMLDNLPHCKAFWIMHTIELAQVMLQCGADDIDGTVVWYDITKVKNTSTHQESNVWDLQRAIRQAGFIPVERDTLYRPIERNGDNWLVVENK